jgi:hypothetical protein
MKVQKVLHHIVFQEKDKIEIMFIVNKTKNINHNNLYQL